MEKTILYITAFAALMFTSCSNEVEKAETTGTLSELIVKRDSLKVQFNKISKELKSVDQEIDALDTGKKLYIVSTVNAEMKLFKHYVEVQGNVNSDQSISMFPEMGGLVRRVYVKEGQAVKKGQVLMKFDSDVLEKNRQEIDTSLELAQTTYEKQKKLWEKNIGSEIQYLQAKTNLESMKGKKAALNAQIAKTKIIAPFSGIIDQIFVKQGEMSSPTMPALRLINLDNVYIEADVSEKYLRLIKKGTEAKIYFPNLNKNIDAKVTMIGSYINPTNRSFRIVVDIQNNEHNIKPNQLAVINLLDLEKQGVVIPSSIILNAPDGSSYVYAVSNENGTSVVKKLPVKTGLSYKNETIIYEGLNKDAILIDKGSRGIQDGQKIKVKN
ncbi:MAG: efflux RND transporter periplasmic adaptor subunit [Flavobacteriales bacterium]|nr:efflux RND transporter periplasmic adaptor subunit [Flavobacteriales bacterium]